MRIFVGNLAYTTTEEELHRLFYGYGAVERTQIITDRETGRSRGFGFVEMPDASQAQAAIAGLNGTERGGRSLSVSEARAREGGGATAPAPGAPAVMVRGHSTRTGQGANPAGHPPYEEREEVPLTLLSRRK